MLSVKAHRAHDFGIGCWQEGEGEDTHYHAILTFHKKASTRRLPDMKVFLNNRGHNWYMRISAPGQGKSALKSLLGYVAEMSTDKDIDTSPALYNFPLPKTVVERAQLTAMRVRRQQMHQHDAMLVVMKEPAFWLMQEKAELDVWLYVKLHTLKEKETPQYIRYLRFFKWVSKASRSEVKDVLTRGRMLAKRDIYSKSYPQLMDEPWPCVCDKQVGGRKSLKFEILKATFEFHGKTVGPSFGLHLNRIKQGLAGRHNAALVFSEQGGTAKTTGINGTYETTEPDQQFQPGYKTGLNFHGFSNYRNKLIKVNDWRSDIPGLEPCMMLNLLEGIITFFVFFV